MHERQRIRPHQITESLIVLHRHRRVLANVTALGLEGDPAIYSVLADRATENARKAGDWRRTRGYLEIKAKWLHRAGKTADETAAKIESAETHVTEADLAEKAASPNYLMVVHHLSRCGRTSSESDCASQAPS